MPFVETAFSRPVQFLSTVVIVVASITVHEYSHALAATGEGDDTPARAGRLTLNPLAHMEWAAIILLVLVGVAWGQTPVNPAKFRHAWGNAWVSAAGPLANLLLLGGAVVLMALLTDVAPQALLHFLYLAAMLNGVLFFLNMLPLPPLDGFHILETFVPALRPYVPWLTQMGFLILLLAFFVLDLGSSLFHAAHWLVAHLYQMLRLR